LFALPLVTFKIVAAIHWKALRLWLKGGTAGAARECRRHEHGTNTILASSRRNDYTETALSAAGQDSSRGKAFWSSDGRI
jgi:hypothetical protein